MASYSTHYGDIFLWVIEVIKSSTTLDHLSSSRKLISLFEKRYRPEMEWNEWVEIQEIIETLVHGKKLEIQS